MNNQGWVKLHRRLKETSFYKRSVVVHLFIHLLLSANQEKKKFYWNGEEIEVLPGQLITGREELSKQTGISPQSIRTAMMVLKSTSTLTIKSTNRFSLITISKWHEYQGGVTSKSTSNLTNNQPTTNQQLTTNKNNKNDKNEKNNTLAPDGAELNKLIGMFRDINPSYERLFSNRTQRLALERMVTKFGPEKMAGLIANLPSILSKPYAPQISTPLELESKMGRLVQFMRQEQLKVSSAGVTKL